MSWSRITLGVALASVVLGFSVSAQDASDPERLLEQADRLAWLKAWTRAEPLYQEAGRLFTTRGDRRNALYAEVNRLRGELPRLPIAEVSQRLAEYLDDPLVQTDDRLRLRCLIIKARRTKTSIHRSQSGHGVRLWRLPRSSERQLGRIAHKANSDSPPF
jgi:hypothetical protein